ncbi:hypothetical protein ACJMK2_024859 [Sinanodonta woodiana]|uniref:C2H2-type domain-containing protein n=1 Tax=Sinanodonta woodiana TaxID=1069815 RepID=A0ABD3XF52_SINWO
MDSSVKEEPTASSDANIWTTHNSAALQAVLNAAVSQNQNTSLPPVPPPAHSVRTTSTKPPDTYLDKALLESAVYQESQKGGMTLPLKAEPSAATDNSSSLSWAVQQNSLLQQYGQFMLDRMLSKSGLDPSTAATLAAVAAAATSAESAVTSQANGSATAVDNTSKGDTDPSSAAALEAQRDVYRHMLNYSMTSALAQQYYLSQYGYNYMQDKSVFGRTETQTMATTGANLNSNMNMNAAPRSHQPAVTAMSATTQQQTTQQLPSIDSVLLNLSMKKGREATATTTVPGSGSSIVRTSTATYTPCIMHYGNNNNAIPAYGLQALANAAIEADPKAFSESETERKDSGGMSSKTELEDISDTDDSNMSPSDSSTSQIQSPPRSSYSHLLDNHPHISIPSAHNQYSLYGHNILTAKAMGTLPGIHHFASLAQKTSKMSSNTDTSLTASHHLSKPEMGMKLKVEPAEEKEIADRTIQEHVAAHHLNAAQQQVQDLTTGSLDAAALLAKLPAGSGLEAELQRHLLEQRMYDYDADPNSLQQEPIQLTTDIIGGKTSSRRKSRGRPTSIETQRDPYGRQISTSSSVGAPATPNISGDERTYDCDICGKQFSHNDRLRRHRKIHTTEKPYKCDICGKGFKEKCNLKHHRYIHTGEKPYKCETCGKAFNQRSSLKTHQKVHTGEKPFKCDICEKPFAQKYLLRQHMKKHGEMLQPQSQTPSQSQQLSQSLP